MMEPPRSGTTLVKTTLQAYTDVCGVNDETWSFLRTNYADVRPPGISDDTADRLVQASRSVTGLFDRYADTIKEQSDAVYFLEKTPEHALRLDYIASHFSDSHVIFVVRDPRDGLRSAQNFAGYWATLPKEDRTGGYLATWRRSVRAYLDHADRDAVISVRYEDFCREPEDSLKGLTASIGIEKQDHQLDPATYGKGHEEKVEGHARLREPITAESVRKWKEELSESEIIRVERTLADEMETLDYALRTT